MEQSPTLTAPAPSTTLWSSLREAILGGHRDYTTGSLNRAIFLLAVPMVLEMVMEMLFGIVDIFYVARLGSDALATVALTEGLVVLVIGIAMGISMGTTAVVARRIGEKDEEGAAVSAVQAVVLGLAVSAVIAFVGVAFGPKLLYWMGDNPRIAASGATYSRVMLGGSGVILMLFLLNGIFRGAGDAAVAMRVLWVANIINLILDPLFIFGLGPFPELGVLGAAVSTTMGRGLGVLYQLWILGSGRGRIRVQPRHFRLDWPVLGRITRISLNGMLQFLIATASWSVIVRIVAIFGSTALAGYTIAIRVIIFSILPSWGLSNAAATLVGQNLGAKQPERAEKSVWRTGFYNMVFLGALSIVMLLFAPRVIGLFTSDADIIQVGSDALRLFSCNYVLFAYGMVIVQAFNGAGDTRTPTVINLACYWCFQLPLAYTLGVVAGFGPRGIFTAAAIAEASLAIVGILVFRRGSWKQKRV